MFGDCKVTSQDFDYNLIQKARPENRAFSA